MRMDEAIERVVENVRGLEIVRMELHMTGVYAAREGGDGRSVTFKVQQQIYA